MLDTDSGTDQRINDLAASVHPWQNPCRATSRGSGLETKSLRFLIV
ncbi:MAG: hypothetical protein F6K40_06170 [Okeania sp. SIO3I5]|nr:hypothetical protein [Okeania sp. SIO3I5]NEQ35894.1 hypothetical protein [Okeania sp. SIO3I5]